MTPLRLGVAALGLHLGQRVEGGHERQVEFVLDAVGHDATEEVVGVQSVDVRDVPDVVDDPVAELAQHLGQALLGQIERTGGDVHHAVAGFDLHDVGLVGAGATRVRGALHTGLGERR